MIRWTDPDTRREHRVSSCTTDARVAEKVRLSMSLKVRQDIWTRRHALAVDHGDHLKTRRQPA